MINEILVYRKRDEPFKFRIITNPTLKWEKLLICFAHVKTINTFAIKNHCKPTKIQSRQIIELMH